MNHKDESQTIKLIGGGSVERLYCTNCQKKKHCLAGCKEGEAPELVKDRCSNNKCECRCRQYYVAKNGKLLAYGVVDDTNPLEDFSPEHQWNETDELIERINADYRAARNG